MLNVPPVLTVHAKGLASVDEPVKFTVPRLDATTLFSVMEAGADEKVNEKPSRADAIWSRVTAVFAKPMVIVAVPFESAPKVMSAKASWGAGEFWADVPVTENVTANADDAASMNAAHVITVRAFIKGFMSYPPLQVIDGSTQITAHQLLFFHAFPD
jgi:hypothetical protein